jgi:hypothetical protein
MCGKRRARKGGPVRTSTAVAAASMRLETLGAICFRAFRSHHWSRHFRGYQGQFFPILITMVDYILLAKR